MLTKKEINEIRDELANCKKPLFFFHDDPDGLASFLLLYRYIREGTGIVVKTRPRLDVNFLRKVKEYEPDKIFVLDIYDIDQEFVDGCKVPIVWIDHHSPSETKGTKYYNPRIRNKDINIPASLLCYQVVDKDMWIAAVGSIGDWHFPYFANDFSKNHPDLLPKEIKNPDDALFKTELGKLVFVFSFVLKGTTSDVLKCVKIMTRIDSPYEILNQTTARGKYIYAKYDKVMKAYHSLIKQIETREPEDDFVIFKYKDKELSFTKDIANETLYNNPDKVIVIGREKNDEVKMSARARNLILPPIVKKSLIGVDGYGGGHEHACGVCVKTKDFDKFLKNFKKEIKENL